MKGFEQIFLGFEEIGELNDALEPPTRGFQDMSVSRSNGHFGDRRDVQTDEPADFSTANR